MSRGLSANLVHKWRRFMTQDRDGAVACAFVPKSVLPEVSRGVETPQFIEADLQHGAVAVRVRWPMPSAAYCGACLREILR